MLALQGDARFMKCKINSFYDCNYKKIYECSTCGVIMKSNTPCKKDSVEIVSLENEFYD